MAEEDMNELEKREQIGYHKGSLSTLSKERAELSKLVNIVEQLIQMHIGALKDLGVDVNEDVEGKPQSQQKKSKKAIEDILD